MLVCSGNARMEPGAVVCRVARSWVRFGTFQLPAFRGGDDMRLVHALADYVLTNLYPHLVEGGKCWRTARGACGPWACDTWRVLNAMRLSWKPRGEWVAGGRLDCPYAGGGSGPALQQPAPSAVSCVPQPPSSPPPAPPLPTLHEDALDPAQPPGGNKYERLLREVCQRTGRLVAGWHGVGFVHGVLNTDNMSILGDTIDYGEHHAATKPRTTAILTTMPACHHARMRACALPFTCAIIRRRAACAVHPSPVPLPTAPSLVPSAPHSVGRFHTEFYPRPLQAHTRLWSASTHPSRPTPPTCPAAGTGRSTWARQTPP